jgi:tyrosyl-tRNA synthetase
MTKEEKSKRIDEIINRGIIKEILPSKEEFKKALLERKLKFYIGADPTGTSLHLSHAKNFMLLEEFRQLGHEVFILFGDFTACIGDPTDKTSTRARLTREQARKNAQNWIESINPLINTKDSKNPAHVVFNSEWLDKLTPEDMIELLSHATVGQLLVRDMFQKRMEENKPIFMHEFIYPMLQGFDSVALDIDVEMCGTDQIFNALVGRELIKKYKNKEKFIVANNLMENPIDGTLMSKSKGTGVFLGTTATKMFEDIMNQPDEMIEILLINNTRVPLETIKKLDIKNNPREAKLFTAREITKIFHSEEDVKKAEESFLSVSKTGIPKDIETIKLSKNTFDINIIDLLITTKLVSSKSEARRLIEQNGISINQEKVTSTDKIITTNDLNNNSLIIQKGKKTFLKVEI